MGAIVAGIKYDSAVLQDSPAEYWKLDESEVGDGTDLLDTEGGHHATALGDWIPGGGPTIQIAGGLAYNGGAETWLDAGTDRLVGTGTGVAIEAWVKLKRPTYIKVILNAPSQPVELDLLGTRASPPAWLLTYDSNGILRFKHSGAGIAGPMLAVPDLVWQHVVATAGPSGTFIFVNGQILAADEELAYLGTTDDIGMSHTIGGQEWTPDTYEPFRNHQILRAASRVAIYTHELSYARALAHYNARFGTEESDSPILNSLFDNTVVALGADHYWRLDETDTADNAVAADSIGTYHGTYKGTIAQVAGPTTAITRGIELAGASTSYVNLTSGRFKAADSPSTILFWARKNASGTEVRMFTQGQSASDNRIWTVNYNDDNRPYIQYRNSTIFAAGVATIAAWHLFVMTHDGTTAKLYVDGAEVSGGGGGTAAVTDDLGTAKYLGPGGGSFGVFAGRLARCAVWDRALTASEVGELWDSRLSPAAPVDARDGPVADSNTWINETGQRDSFADILYRIEMKVSGYYGEEP